MTILVRQNIYGAWLDGEATATEALQSLCDSYEELDDTYKQFERMREDTRSQISHVVSTMDGERATVKGFGFLIITPPSVTKSYDREKMGALIAMLRDQGFDEIADQIVACRVEKQRTGSLRIEREK